MVAGGWAWHIECTERPGARAGARARRASDGSEGMLIIFTHVDAAVHYDADAQGSANAHRCPQRCAGIFSKRGWCSRGTKAATFTSGALRAQDRGGKNDLSRRTLENHEGRKRKLGCVVSPCHLNRGRSVARISSRVMRRKARRELVPLKHTRYRVLTAEAEMPQ